jgi:gas vesicle protein
MGQTPEELKREIAQTRRDLGYDVDALSEKVSPRRVVHRRVERARGSMTQVKERVMGSTSSGAATVSDKASAAGSSMGDVMSSGQDTVIARTEGNPLAAGLLAFASGWLISSVFPASKPEERAATALQEKASEHGDQVKAELSQAAQDLKSNLQGPAQEAVQGVRESTTEATETVKAEGRSAAQDVAEESRGSAQAMRDSGQQ